MYQESTSRIKIGVSSCLLGNQVRYDGIHKKSELILSLEPEFELVAFCPEVAIGLSVPRDPIELVSDQEDVRLLKVGDPGVDFTTEMTEYAESQLAILKDFGGFIFKSKSPSCGLNSADLHGVNGPLPGKFSGLFAKAISEYFPEMPMAEEVHLSSAKDIENFASAVKSYLESVRPS